ncbi:MAG: hypothetical protein AABW89_00355 [Nanoarchaeota archaeon]
MERPLTAQEKRMTQNVGGAIFIFAGIYLFIKGQMDGLSLGVLLIMGFGISQDARNIGLFALKYIFAKVTRSQVPTYDLSKGKITQTSGRDSIVNHGTIIYHK